MKYLLVIIIVIVISIALGTTYKIGLSKGIDIGIIATLDTVNKIADKTLKSDTSVTRLILVHPDTTTYILSRKTILPWRKKH